MRQSEAALFLPIIQAWANGDDLYFKDIPARDNQSMAFNGPIENYTTKPKQWYRVAKMSRYNTKNDYYTLTVSDQTGEQHRQQRHNFVEWLTPRVYY